MSVRYTYSILNHALKLKAPDAERIRITLRKLLGAQFCNRLLNNTYKSPATKQDNHLQRSNWILYLLITLQDTHGTCNLGILTF